ncbi:MAG: four helix bundle protein [Deltaproteobacteria bacterium]|nr:four helix bundle protein [Deltaproteobacteria bacterium]
MSAVYCLTNKDTFRRYFALRDQLRRAAVSILSNIAEGFERGVNTEFCQFLYIAKGSAAEVRAQLYIALDQNYITQTDFKETVSLCKVVSNQLSGFITYLKKSEFKGQKFKKP